MLKCLTAGLSDHVPADGEGQGPLFFLVLDHREWRRMSFALIGLKRALFAQFQSGALMGGLIVLGITVNQGQLAALGTGIYLAFIIIMVRTYITENNRPCPDFTSFLRCAVHRNRLDLDYTAAKQGHPERRHHWYAAPVSIHMQPADLAFAVTVKLQKAATIREEVTGLWIAMKNPCILLLLPAFFASNVSGLL